MDALILDCTPPTGITIVGECISPGYLKKIQVLSFTHGISQTMTGPSTAARAVHQNLTIVKDFDSSSLTLLDMCDKAILIPAAKLMAFHPGQPGDAWSQTGTPLPYLTYQLTGLIVASINVAGGSDGSKPQETITFSYNTIEWDYRAMNADGSPSAPNSVKWNRLTSSAM